MSTIYLVDLAQVYDSVGITLRLRFNLTYKLVALHCFTLLQQDVRFDRAEEWMFGVFVVHTGVDSF